ncbi:sensor domain-containing diguanylate cyclase [Paraburkholderia adhaesiva]|uniref:sensor domain-containing diguanylate cyclase n=1 Tax=Paraburkholderia adhaesiva TaxID=2883244 RepID=UPI001F2A62ED|nr:diguanylate cyclase [Paraburkholderia adhaesiva]
MPVTPSPVDAQADSPAPRAALAAVAAGPDSQLDGLMRLAERHFGVAAACVIPGESSGRWSGAGLDAPLRDALRSLQDASGAPWLSEPLVVADTSADPAWHTFLLTASALPLRFVASWPLRRATGESIGSLCLIDYAPRELGEAERASLDDFARIASALVDQQVCAATQCDEVDALRTRERLLTLAIAGSGTGIWDRDVVTGEIQYSTGWKAILGYTDDELTSRIEDSYKRLHPDDVDYVKAAMQAHFEGRTESYEVEHRIRCKDGRYKWICSRGKVMSRDNEGRALRMVGTTTDITSMREMAERLRESATLVTNLTNEVPGLVFQCCRLPDGRLSFPYASAGIAEIYELTPEAVAQDGSCIDALIHPDDLDAWHASFAHSAQYLQPWHLEYRVQLPTQGLRWRQGDAKPQRLANGVTVWHGFITDVTERKRIEAELHEFATTDGLTLLSNRRHFMTRLEAQLSQLRRVGGAPSAVLMCDLDHFKSINDCWGHAVGDQALRHFADILRKYLRAGDVAGRIGGEEFAVLIGAASVEGARVVAERIQRHVAEQPLASNAGPVALTVSIGITEMTAEDANAEAALSRSDFALYRAKKNGRNRIECA